MSTYTTDSTTPKASRTLLDRAKRDFKKAVDGWKNQRKREIEDLRFQVAENQWDDLAKQQRAGGTFGGVTTPARPMLSISQIQQPQQLVKNQAAAADLGVSVHPVSETASKDNAEIKQGLYRRIERDSNAEQQRLWAFDRAVQCGVGWYRVITQWDDDGDDPSDQEIVIKRILRQDSVYIDPSAQEADFSDAEFGFVTAWLSEETFERLYPDAKGSRSLELQDQADEPDWVRGSGDAKAYQVAEYFYKDHDYEEVPLADGRIRKRDKISVKHCTLTGAEILEEQDWPGKHIPLIPVIGRELQPFDSERRLEGMVRPARDSQKFFNAAASTLVERMFLEPKVPFIGYEGQFTDKGWAYVNTRNLNYIEVPVKPDGAGGTLPIPQRAQIDQAGMSVAMMAIQEAKGFVQSATAVYDPSLGETPKRGASGRSVIAQQQQADAASSNYLQNLANISMPYEAKVILDLIPYIYDRPGRVTRVLGGEDEKEKTVMLGKPFIMGPDGQTPQEAPPGHPQAQTYDLSKGKYSISVSVGKSYQTRLQQGAETLPPIMEHLPPDAQIMLLPTWLKFLDTPGAPEAAEMMTKYRDSKFPGLTSDENTPPDPQQMQAQIQAMKQKGQEMGQQLQMAADQIKTDQAKQQAQIQIAQINSDKELKLQAMKDATSIAVARINASVKIGLAAQEAQEEAIALDEQQAHEVGMQALDLQHAADQAQQGQAHEAGMAAMPPPAPTEAAPQGPNGSAPGPATSPYEPPQ